MDKGTRRDKKTKTRQNVWVMTRREGGKRVKLQTNLTKKKKKNVPAKSDGKYEHKLCSCKYEIWRL